MLILLVAGMPGAGKEEFLSVARSMNIPFLRMGDIVRNLYASTNASEEGLSVGQFADRERKIHGKNIWAKRALEKMSGDIFLIDGCRSMDEVLAYKELSNNVKIVAIHTAPDVRYRRLVERAREDAPKNVEEFDIRDNREMSWGLGNVIALSDIMLDNSSTLSKFYSTSKELLEAVRK
ncbi:MAG: AAA family ATPase [Candidatus Methanomethylophilaceae archaeon]|nr:AAA family ATPase [Candidatus Methanomethylophilaceae archaeon]MDY0224090.1 AAA family ATPase [Candidatus Methanomethylophilaceae archaeon]